MILVESLVINERYLRIDCRIESMVIDIYYKVFMMFYYNVIKFAESEITHFINKNIYRNSNKLY